MKTSSSPASGTSVVNVKSDKPVVLKQKFSNKIVSKAKSDKT